MKNEKARHVLLLARKASCVRSIGKKLQTLDHVEESARHWLIVQKVQSKYTIYKSGKIGVCNVVSS